MNVGRQKAISILIVLALIVAAVAGLTLLPKQYTVGQRLSQTTAFWNDREAFLFLAVNTIGRSRNFPQQKLADTRYGYLTVFFGAFSDFSKQEVIAYHLLPMGQLDSFALPEHTAASGSWGLVDGQLQLSPPRGGNNKGFRWDGEKFGAVVAQPAASMHPSPATTDKNLAADDLENNEEDEGSGLLSKAERKIFKDAGWHYKSLTGYEASGAVATLPIALSGNTFILTIESSPLKKSGPARFDFLTIGTRAIRLVGDKLSGGSQTLWSQSGWQEVPRQDYEALQRQYGRQSHTPRPLLAWLLLLALVLAWRFGSWIHLLFTFATTKRRVLKNMATSFSFPPATPAQFPQLDLEALDRYTRDFEGMGFERLLDFSLVSDSATNPPSFCRLFAHRRNHCFGELSQIFPKGKLPLPLKCSIQSCLQNGWTLSFSDRKPQAASSLLRRRKAIGICIPETTSYDLLQAFLKMREQVCLDLGIQTVHDDTLEAYIAKMQRSATEYARSRAGKELCEGSPGSLPSQVLPAQNETRIRLAGGLSQRSRAA
jgi:hypothetical protein